MKDGFKKVATTAALIGGGLALWTALAADWPVVPARGTGVDGALDMARAWAP